MLLPTLFPSRSIPFLLLICATAVLCTSEVEFFGNIQPYEIATEDKGDEKSIFSLGNERHVVSVCENSILHAECGDGKVIRFLEAHYGRLTLTTCNHNYNMDWNVNCRSNVSEEIMRKKCDNKRECNVEASNSVFGDPCYGTIKYLEMQYLCVNDDPDNPDRAPDNVIDANPDFDCTVRQDCFTRDVFCKWYYYCVDKRPEVKECAGDQCFDYYKNKCLKWWMLICDKQIIPDDTTLPPPGTDASTSSTDGNTITSSTSETSTGTNSNDNTENYSSTVTDNSGATDTTPDSSKEIKSTTDSSTETRPTSDSSTVEETTEMLKTEITTPESSTSKVEETTEMLKTEITTPESSTSSVEETTEKLKTEITTSKSSTPKVETTTEMLKTETTTPESTSKVEETTEMLKTEITTSTPKGITSTETPITECDEKDLKCLKFKCPQDMGNFPHPTNKQLFIFCVNWKPRVKTCAKGLVFSETFLTCVRVNLWFNHLLQSLQK